MTVDDMGADGRGSGDGDAVGRGAGRQGADGQSAEGQGAGDLSRGAGTALWRQIAERVEADILRGQYPPGEKLPTEHALAEAFGVNRHTARRAVMALAEKGLVRVEQGRGTFVQESVIDYRLSRRTRFSQNLSAERREAGGRLLGLHEEPAAGAVARALGVAEGALVIVIERLGEADGRPINVSSHYFPKARVPGLAAAYRESGSISSALAACGVADYTRQVTRITARPVRSADARVLQQALTRPILMTESVNVDAEGRSIEYSVGRWASDRVQLVVEPNG